MRHGGPINADVVFIVFLDPWCSIVEVGWEDGFGTIDHEEWRVAGVPAGCPEHYGKLDNLAWAKLVQPIEDPRLEAL